MENPHVYVFADKAVKDATEPGTPILHAGGLAFCFENVECLGILEKDRRIRVNLDGVFIGSIRGEERIADPVIHVSDRLIQDGITENWFTEGWALGNGVTAHRTHAKFDTKMVEHKMGRTLAELKLLQGYLDLSSHRLYEVHDRTEGWEVYERRWRAGTCPQCTHGVHLLWMVTKHELGGYGYKRIQEIVEEGAALKHPEAYDSPGEPGKYFSTTRAFNPQPSTALADLLTELGVK